MLTEIPKNIWDGTTLLESTKKVFRTGRISTEERKTWWDKHVKDWWGVDDIEKAKPVNIADPIDGLPGFYLAGLNTLRMEMKDAGIIKDEWAYLDVSNENADERCHSSYGVCDSPQQLMDKFGHLIKGDKRNFVVTFWEVRKEDQEEQGWRWHKWGGYIGDHEPKHEYLRDEDDSIQNVFCYHIFEIQSNAVKA